VKEIRAAALAVHALPIERFPTAEHLYSFSGLAPARYESATIRKARAISRQAPASGATR
jgi:transposase